MNSRLPLILSVIALMVATAALLVSLGQLPTFLQGVPRAGSQSENTATVDMSPIATTEVAVTGTPTPGDLAGRIPTISRSLPTPWPGEAVLAGQVMCTNSPGASLAVDIYIDDVGGSVVRLTSIGTDENGRWVWARLAPGRYYVYSGSMRNGPLPERTPAVQTVDLAANESRDLGRMESGMCP